MDIRNDSAGSTYYECDLMLVRQLADAVWALPHVQQRYASRSDMFGSWFLQIATFEVDYGWDRSVSDPDSGVNFSHKPGIPGLNFDIWFDGTITPGQDDLRFRVSIPKSQLDADGDGWRADDPGDYILEVDPGHPVPFAVTATSGPGGMFYDGDALGYRLAQIEAVTVSAPHLAIGLGPNGQPTLTGLSLVPGTEYRVERRWPDVPGGTWTEVVAFTAEGASRVLPVSGTVFEPCACFRLRVP